MSATEGKSCITNTGFTEIVRGCRAIANVENPSLSNYSASIFAAAWVLLQWNLVSRSVSVEDLQLEHLDWSGDRLHCHFAKTKSDQTGEGNSNIKSVYANPNYKKRTVQQNEISFKDQIIEDMFCFTTKFLKIVTNS